MTSSDVPTDLADTLAEIRTDIAYLKDLFQRRLLDDKARNVLAEAAQEQLAASQRLLEHRALEQLTQEVLLAVDRLQANIADPLLVQSAADELLEVFRRRALARVPNDGAFDPRVHEAIGVEDRPDLPDGTILTVHREGYLLSDRLLRPAQVTISRAPHSVNEGGGDHHVSA